MHLALDIGNSAAKAGLFDASDLQSTARLDLNPATASADDWCGALQASLRDERPCRAGLSSVVPAATARVRQALDDLWNLAPFVVSAPGELQLPFALAYRTPATLGADRLAAAAGAWMRYGAGPKRSVLALDAGTALTYEVLRAVGTQAVYEGGAIAPGPALLQRALTEGTAQLTTVSLALPPSPIGATTEEALQSGLLHGLLDSVEGLLGRLSAALEDASPIVVSTGGWGAFLHKYVERVTHYDPHLVLHGIERLRQLNE